MPDQPSGRGDQQHRERQKPPTLDPLERPEAADRLVGGQLRVAMAAEVLPHGEGLRNPALPKELSWSLRQDLAEHGLAGRSATQGEPLLPDDPCGIGDLQLARDKWRHVVLPQEPADSEGQPGVDDQGGDNRGDDAADEDAGQDADGEGGQCPGGERDPA